MTKLHWIIDEEEKDGEKDEPEDANPNHRIQSLPCVIKPLIGVASDGVYKCTTWDDCQRAFSKLYHKPKYGGGVNEAVLAQAFVAGREYAVDTVTAASGETKVVACWRYVYCTCQNDALES